MKKSGFKTKRLAVSGVMIAIACVLSMIKVWQMPLGGSITLLSMLPIVMISIKYGVKWGLFSSFVYSVMQILLSISELMSWGMTVKIWIGCIVFDYVIAYTVIGLAGIFRKKGTAGICGGVALALALRFVSHFISGVIFFDVWCEWSNVYLYSLCYNGTYMLPEMVLTMIAAVIVFKQKSIIKLMGEEEA